MESKKALRVAAWVTGSLLVILTGAVFIIPKIIDSTNKDKKSETEPESVGTKPSPQIPQNPIGDKEAVKKFQDWMDIKHPKWLDNGTSLNKATGYGNFGSQTSKAWAKFSSEYTVKSEGGKPVASNQPIKVYSKIMNNPIYSQVGDVWWYKLAGNSEWIGTTNGTIKKSFAGVPYMELNWPDGTKKYVIYNSVKYKA